MSNRNSWGSRNVIGITLIVGSMLILLGYSTIGNTPSVNAVASLQMQPLVPPPPATVKPQIPGPLPAIVKPSQTNLMHAATGTANLVWDAKKQTLGVRITMNGLAPNSTAHVADISQGSCLAGGKQLAVLNPIAPTKSPKKPENSSRTTLSKATFAQLATGIPQSGWFINVYNSSIISTDKTTIACGDIINFNTSMNTDQFVNVTLGPTKDPNQAANGIATFSIANGQLTVTITMSGLLPNSTHQAHIHQGSCKAQGPVVYPLTPVVADKTGNGTSVTVIPKVTSIPKGWYVNVHQGATAADLNTQAGFDPLVCGDVAASKAPVPVPSVTA